MNGATGLKFTAWALVLAVPALAEVSGQRALADAFEHEDAAMTLDVRGLGLDHVGLSKRGWSLRAEHVQVMPTDLGIEVEVENFHAAPKPEAKTRPTPAEAPPQPKAQAPAAREPDLLERLRGTPVVVRARGSTTVDLPSLGGLEGLVATVHDPRIVLPGDGTAQVDATTELHRGDESLGKARAALRSADGKASRGVFAVESKLGKNTRMNVEGRWDDTLVRAELGVPGDEVAWAALEVSRDARALDLAAEAMPLGALSTALSHWMPERLTAADLHLDDARFSGHVALTRGPEGIHAALRDVVLADAGIEHPRLAPRPVSVRALEIEGVVDAGEALTAAIDVGHEAARVSLDLALDEDGVRADAKLARVDCSEFVASMPDGFVPIVAATTWEGDVEGRFALDVERSALDHYAEHPPAPDEGSAPGELVFEFPFLERCQVAAPAPGLDVGAVAGAHRHRFVMADGSETTRILDRGAPGFVSIDRVPRLAQAFVLMEDTRFWDHDGFDPEQIERAFWHDMAARRFERGASTISQQTARNLWLGVDRSLDRKLQEAVLAAQLEAQVDKRRILELYVNIIELGPNVHGVADAAEYHFGKSPERLTLLESLHIAALAPAPVTYSRRFASGEVDEAWREKLRAQLRRLRIRGLISGEEAQKAARAQLRLVKHEAAREATAQVAHARSAG